MMASAKPAEPEGWHLDKKVPITIVGVIVIQLFGGLWFLAKLDGKIEDQASRLAKTEAQLSVIDREARDFGNRIARIEEKSSAMLTLLQTIEQRLERALNGRRTDLP
jgi:hypothetical protein